MSLGGALGGPRTAFQYDWNMLPIGQQLWLEHLTLQEYPPLQAASYNLDQVMELKNEGRDLNAEAKKWITAWSRTLAGNAPIPI